MLEYILKEHGDGKVSRVLKDNIPVGNKFIKGLMELTGLSFTALFYYSEEEDE